MILLFFPPPAGTPQSVGPFDLLHDGQSAIYDLAPQFVIDVGFIDTTAEFYALEQVYFTTHLDLLDPVSEIYPLDDVEFVVHLSLIDESSGIFALDQVYFTVKFPWIIDRTGKIFDLLVNAVQTSFTFDWVTSDAPYEEFRYVDFELDWQEAPLSGRDLGIDARIYENVTSDLAIDYKVGLTTLKDFTFDWQSAASTTARATFTFSWQTNGVLPLNIFYAGTDITRDVYIDECNFVSQVNGQAGTCVIRVKDPDQNKVFVVGENLDLEIEGQYMWRGFVSKVSYEFPFSYGNTTPSGIANQTRIIRIEGTDINVLFEKRWTFKKSDPTQGAITYKYDNVPDVVAIKELVTNWLDLSGDGIDVTTKVENVGTINTEEDASPFSPGWTWGQAMSSVAFLPVAIYYINPEKQLVYTDAETQNTDMVLSDRPSLVSAPDTGIGYREASYVLDSTHMVNDYLAWGAAGGSSSKVFKRETDQASIDQHNRWQGAKNYYSGVYKQSTINKIADSVVNGSPQSHRGGADDTVQVTCSTYTPGFFPGMKVRFISYAHGIDTVLPIRSMEITFAGAVLKPKYTLRLGFDRDPVYGYFDNIVYAPPGTIPDVVVPDPIRPRVQTFPGVVLDSFSRITEWSYIPYVTRETGLPGQGPDPATGWVSEGWTTGEELEWTHSMTPLYENPQVYEPTWVDGEAGILLSAMPYVPQYHDGGSPGANTVIPNISSGGQTIDRKNLLIQFSIGRHERVLKTRYLGSTYNNAWYAFGPAQWHDVDSTIPNPGGIGTFYYNKTPNHAHFTADFWDTTVVPEGTEEGDISFEQVDFVNPPSIWSKRWAQTWAGVTDSTLVWTLHLSALSAGGNVRRIVWVGSRPTDLGGRVDPGVWWSSAGGGFAGQMPRYGGGCATWYTSSPEELFYWINSGGGLRYFGGKIVYEVLFIGDDVATYLPDQKIYVKIIAGNQTLVFNREGGGPSGFSESGADAIPMLMNTTTGGTNVTTKASYFDIEPGVKYWVRWYRPNAAASYVKIWAEGNAEPTEWTVSQESVSGTKSINPTLVVDDSIVAGTSWSVATGQPILYTVPSLDEPISGLTSGSTYFVITTGDPAKIKLAGSYADALAGNFIAIDGTFATGSHTFGWYDYNPSGSVPQGFSISARKYPYQTYKAQLHFIGSISDSVADRDEQLPEIATRPPRGVPYFQEKPSIEGNDRKTRWPYVPGTLMIWVNGTFQRPGLDFEELDPAAGTFRFIGFTPDNNDKIQLWYLVA